MSSVLGAMLALSILVCLLGTVYRILRLLTSPVTRAIPITPAANSRWGVLIFMVTESLTFRSLWKASPITWVLGWVFHGSLMLMLLIHLRFVRIPPPAVTVWLMPYTSLVSGALILSLSGLLVRRVAVDRIRYVSSVSDYLHVLLLLFISMAGVWLAAGDSVNVFEVTLFVQGLFSSGTSALGVSPLLVMHILGACVVLLIYPFSKLFHGPLLWFNPTRSQPQRPRS